MIMNKRSQHSGFGARQDSQQPEAFGRENKNDAKNQESSNAPGQLLSDKGDHRPLRERFNVNTHTGGASFSLPIQTSPGRSGFGPSLELAYDSGAANVNGVFGLGWHLQGIDSISRKTSTGVPLYDDEKDIFVHSAVGDLVPVMQESDNKPVERKVKDGDVGYAVRLYRPRVEGVPTRVERWHCLDGSAHTHWRSVVSGSVTTIFGRDARSRISYSDESRGAGKDELVFSWLPEEMYDGHGNHMVFAYSGEDEDSLTQRVGSSLCEAHRSPTSRSTQRYLKSIKYGNIRPNRDPAEWKVYPAPADDPLYWMFEVVFDYGDHPEEFPTTRGNTDSLPLRQDPFSTHTSGFEIRTYRLCHRVLMFHHFPELKKTPDCLVAATMLHYETNPRSGASILTSHTMCGCDVDNNGDYTSSQMPSTTFEYGGAPELGNLRCEEIDMDISGLSTPAAQWVDLDGDGIPGVLSEVPGGGWYYSRNMSHDKATDGDPAKPIFGGPTLVPQIPSLANSNLWTFEDLTGNGQMDVVFRSPSNQIYGFYERSDEGALVSFTPLVNFPSTYSPADPTWQKIDLDGDGHPDLLDLKVRANNELGWYALLGRQGYSAAKSTKGAPMLPRGGTSHVMFCDMNGDGLSDILLVNHSHICYWPNHGHGQFGSKVIMENPPFLAGLYSFTPLRIRTADVTGSGTADLIYLPPEGGAWVYYNHSGNGWSDVDIIPQFPPLDRFCAVSVFDIVGRGTECLCWTSDHLNPGSTKVRFLDLMGGSKPGLVTKCSNGTGAQVEVAYRASTQYRLDSERAGHPWATRLPFPVHCVERTISTDLIAKTSSTTRYAYHNGYYDYEERQFAGFQMVDEWETEDLSISQKTKLQRPPVHTKNWFYIGLESLDEGKPWGDYYAVGQDWQTPLRSTLCTDRGLENTMTPQEVRDAYRALSGHTRRQEIFSPDGSSRAGIPYVVTDHAYDAVMQQGTRQIQRYGIFRVNSREQVAFQLERQRNEPRIQHTFTLQTDFYGNVCKQAVVNYGKRESSLPKESDRCAQEETVIQYTETDYTNEIDPFLNSAQLDTVSAQPNPTTFDYFQAPLPCEVRNYRVFPGDASEEQRCNGKFTSQDLERLIAEAREIPVSRERNVSATDTEKILLGQQRTLYCEENLRGPKRVGELDARSIEYQSYQLAVTRSMLEEILKNQQSPLPESFDLIGEARRGGYVAIDDSDTWWIPSSRMLFREKSDSATSTNSLAAAQAHFYIADGEVDPFGSISSHRFDRYWFLTESSIDAVGNEIIFENEYLHLQPKAITDANKNRVESVSDAIGRNVGVAMVGKPGKDKGDSLEGFNVVISPEQLAKFIQDPAGDSARQLLGNAGHRVISNDYYTQEGEVFIPPFRAQLARDTHYQSTTASQISVSITYLNGNGEAIQTVSLSVDIKGVRKWAVSSAIQDSKGEVARQFLPVYSSNHRFKFPFEGPATTVLRDGVNRVVGTLQPDQLWTKTRTTPWFSKTYDTGDTIGIQDPAEDEDVGYYFKLMDRKEYFPTWYTQKSSSESDVERKAATNAEVYKSTPTTTHLDSLGQHIMTTLDNGIQGGRPDTRYARTEYDLRGNVHILRDALDRIVTKARYDLLGRPLHSVNLDSGHRWIFSDCDGALLLSWSGRRCRRRVFYDAMRRVQKLTVASGEEVEKTVVANVYGDDRNALPHLEAFDNNLKGKLYECRDQSGKQTNHQFDFKGNCVRSSLQHAAEYKKIVDWSYGNELESTIYTTTQSFDALGHVVQSTAKDDDQETCEVIRTYDVAGRVKSIIGSPGNDGPRASIENIEYSADGNVTRIEHGDNSFTTHSYNPKTRKLTNTVTQRSDPRSCLQNVSYVYDCTGRVIFEDRHHQYAFHANTAVTPSPEFTYNAIGQLTSATGREQVTGSEKQLRVYDSCSRANRGSRNEGEMVGYVERYHYDKVGNMEKMEHQPKTKTYTGWTREFSYNESSCVEPTRGVYSNRLSKTTLTGSSYEGYKYNDVGPSDSRRDEYDTNGCMTKMPGYPAMTWDYNDQLRTVSTQRVRGDATPAITWYVYNAQGERARKITECGTSAKDASTPTKMKETRYLPLHDIYTKYAQRGTVKVREVTSCGISDPALGRSPTIMIETTRKYTRSGIEQQHLLRYQISDRLEVDDQSNVVSYEEFSPYGVSTYQSRNTDAPRKYRFAGYQRDSESGFYLCGARYYMPWLGRWSAPDPLGTVDGMNLYNYAGSDPVNWEDHRGTSKTRKAPSRRKDSVISGRITRRGDQPRMRSYPSYMQKRIRNVVESAIAHFSQPGNRAINSHYNPSKLADNCSYVTRAYLQGNGRGARQLITANDLSGEYDRQGLRGLTEIRERLQDDPGSYGRQFSTENRWKSAPKFINKGIREYRIGACSWPREVGVVYRRPDGSGHVVVGKNIGKPYRRYVDYQRDKFGEDVTKDVMKSRIHMLFDYRNR